jgi:hypothetical protein
MSGGQVSSPRSGGLRASSWLEVLPLCDGFRVESSDGGIGVVSALHYAPSTRWDAPNALTVRAGRSSNMLLVVPVTEIESVFLAERRIVLRASPRIEAAKRVPTRRRALASQNGHVSARMMAGGIERVLTGWCQGAVAEDEEGRAVRPWSSEARRWSLLGALLAGWDGGSVKDLGQAVTALHTSTDESPLEVWNDDPERTQQDVLAAFERATEALRRREDGTAFAGDDRFDFSLEACEGFRVDSDSGRIGIVDAVRLSGEKQAVALAIRTGLFGRRLRIVPVSEVERVVPRQRRVLLRSATR